MLFGIGKLNSGGSIYGGRVRDYLCGCCDLKIRFDPQTNDVSDVSEEDFYVLNNKSFPHDFLDRTHGGTSPHPELCNSTKINTDKTSICCFESPFF